VGDHVSQEELENKRKERGAQLRALVVSWDEGKTFVDVLRDQQEKIDAGTFAPSEEWSVAADEILGFYMSRPKMTAWDEKKPAEVPLNRPDCDSGPRLIIP
jgi:hypothetical protein